jgi:hypothetical protein
MDETGGICTKRGKAKKIMQNCIMKTERDRQKRTIVEYRGKMRTVLKQTFGCDDVQRIQPTQHRVQRRAVVNKMNFSYEALKGKMA